MEGMGIYTWQDGRMYKGQYKDDKKHGYGVYSWADQRLYQGMWFKGKQHGLGIYTVPSSEAKCGLWEDGKRIEWFDAQQAQSITQGRLEYHHLFTKQESAYNVEKTASFNRPNGFDD